MEIVRINDPYLWTKSSSLQGIFLDPRGIHLVKPFHSTSVHGILKNTRNFTTYYNYLQNNIFEPPSNTYSQFKNTYFYNNFLVFTRKPFLYPGQCKLMRVTFGTLECNIKIKNQQSLNLIVFFEILPQNILL